MCFLVRVGSLVRLCSLVRVGSLVRLCRGRRGYMLCLIYTYMTHLSEVGLFNSGIGCQFICGCCGRRRRGRPWGKEARDGL